MPTSWAYPLWVRFHFELLGWKRGNDLRKVLKIRGGTKPFTFSDATLSRYTPQMPEKPPPVLNQHTMLRPYQCAALLGVSLNIVYQYIEAGTIPRRKVYTPLAKSYIKYSDLLRLFPGHVLPRVDLGEFGKDVSKRSAAKRPTLKRSAGRKDLKPEAR
jgi:hypothetical protein